MANDTLKATADALVAHCKAHTEGEALKTLYHPDIVSVEAVCMPGNDSAETKGIAGVEGKHEWWGANFEVHSASVDGPFPHGDDRFAVIFEMDATDKNSGQRHAMKEVGVYTVDDAGKITREEFFYGM